MKKLRFLYLILLICSILSISSPLASALDAPRLKSADAYLVIDMKTGTELVELNPDMQHSIASLTKIMTCLLGVEAVEKGTVKLTDIVTAPEDCLQGLDISSSNAGITPGEEMSFQNLLYCALVHSANDACNVIAVHVAGSIGSFVNMMNARAEELGCENTHFVDTDGMLNRSEGHYSSPRDLYKIASEAMKHTLFAQICGTADYTIPATNKREAFDIHNSNALMSTDGLYGDQYIYSGVTGIKTGFTKPAGYCLVSVCERNNEKIMCIVLGCNGPLTYTYAGEYQNFLDSITLYDWAFKNFTSRTIFLAGEPMKRVSVQYAKDNATVALCPNQSLQLFLSTEIEDKDIVVEIHPDESKLVAPITQGDEIGYANIFVAGELKSTIPMLADASVEMENSLLIKAKIKAFFTSSGFKLTVIALAIILIGILIFKNYRKTMRRKILRTKIQNRQNAKWTEANASYAYQEDIRRKSVKSETPPKPLTSTSKKTPQNNASIQNRAPSGRTRVPIETVPVNRNISRQSSYPHQTISQKTVTEKTQTHPVIKTYKTPSEDADYNLDDILNSFK